MDIKALTGYAPYPWQQNLYDRLASGDLPDALDIPTGLGKTSAMALWLAARAENPNLPRRLIYVVDRRAVVDQATEEAEKLADQLEMLPEFKTQLGLPEGARLPISTLRGQYADNRKWSENPALPAIVVGTVDMIGSRLLFGGYRLSPKVRPIHAGLVARDSLIVLDEAHLNVPFQGLLQDAAKLADPAHATAVPAPLKVITLTATSARGSGDRLSLTPEDEAHPLVQAKLKAPKPMRVEDADPKKLPETLANNAWQICESGQKPLRVLIFCTSREVAQKTSDALGKFLKAFAKATGKSGLEETHLKVLTGQSRVWERASLKDEAVYQVFLTGTPKQDFDLSVPQFLVATSAGEVGIDLDAQAMVCDLVSWERMVQRLGRVNRRGSDTPAPIVVIDAQQGKDDELERLAATRALLEALPIDDTGNRDASVGALRTLRADASKDFKTASTPDPLRPRLTAALLDGWALTSLQGEHTGSPDIEPWIRGWIDDDEPQCEVFWRAYLPWRNADLRPDAKEVSEYFDAAPPHLTEMLEAPVYRVIEILRSRLEVEKPDTDGDLQNAGILIVDKRGRLAEAYTPDRLRNLLENPRDRKRFESQLAGNRILISANLGGLEKGLLDPRSDQATPTLDTSEEWQNRVGVRFVPPGKNETDDTWRPDFEMIVTAEGATDERKLAVLVERDGNKDAGDLAISRRQQTLKDHHRWAGVAARKVLDGLAIEDPWRSLLTKAIEAHDLGKARKVWQTAMNAPPGREPWAKTNGKGVRANVMGGYRHEFGSYVDLLNSRAFDDLPDDQRDLALHLILSHHGYARPWILPELKREAGAINLSPQDAQQTAFEAALRFARLQKRWGPWGLAWWEAVFRASDWLASSWNDSDDLPSGLKAELLATEVTYV